MKRRNASKTPRVFGGFGLGMNFWSYTTPKFNIAPEKWRFETTWEGRCSVAMLNFGRAFLRNSQFIISISIQTWVICYILPQMLPVKVDFQVVAYRVRHKGLMRALWWSPFFPSVRGTRGWLAIKICGICSLQGCDGCFCFLFLAKGAR